MYLMAWAIGQSTEYPLGVAANRDEQWDRPTLASDVWHSSDGATILGGRDGLARGSCKVVVLRDAPTRALAAPDADSATDRLLQALQRHVPHDDERAHLESSELPAVFRLPGADE